jgi:UPF0716 family protein affecting phage T7 exclusion
VPKQSIVSVFIIAWLAAELTAYVLFFKVFGALAILGVGFISIILGIGSLKRAGRNLSYLATTSGFEGLRKESANSLLLLLGAILLIAPGLISDLMGLVCLGAHAFGFGSSFGPRDPPSNMINLSRNEWRRMHD